MYKAEKYFNQLINDYPNSQYYNESRLWLEYSYLKLNLIDSSLSKIDLIEKDFISNKKRIDDKLFFLLYNLKGDIFIQLENYNEAFIEFEKSLNFADSKTKKIMMYSKLVVISESLKQFNRAIYYLNEIQILSIDKDVKIESFIKWLDIMKKLNLYDEIIIKIQEKLTYPEFDSPTLQDELNIELGISYMKKNNFSNSKNIFNKIIESSNQKKIKAQSYYWLGYISLFHEFELDLALEYFNLVNETQRSSKYNKQSREYSDNIDSYKMLLEEYSFLSSDNSDEAILQNEEEYFSPNNNFTNDLILKDSLLFIIAEKLFFDFNQVDLSIEKHNHLIEIYPSSQYAIRSKKIVNQLAHGSNFNNEILDSLNLLRDSAWDRFDNHIIDTNPYVYNLNSIGEAINMFENIAVNYNDFYSYYSLGLIYENHLYDPYLSIENYLKSYKLCEDDNFRNNIKNKMLLIENDLNNEKSIIYKKLNYLKAIQFITKNFNVDSVINYLNMNYETNSLKNEIEIISKNLHDFIINNKNNINDFEIYILNDSLIAKNISLPDSITYITFNYYKDQDSIFYIDELRKKNILLSLFKDSILYSNSIDTLEIKGNNYNNKMPNINNDIAPNFNNK